MRFLCLQSFSGRNKAFNFKHLDHMLGIASCSHEGIADSVPVEGNEAERESTFFR